MRWRETRLRCRVQVVGQLTHVSQVMTGFAMLDRAGRINASFEFAPDGTIDQPSHIVVATVGKRVRVAYDVGDGGGVDRNVLDRVDLYFKRSFQRDGSDDRVQPYGLNYGVTWAADSLENHRGLPTVEQVEGSPRRSERPRVIFITRLWDPEGEPDERGPNFDREVASERHSLNELRVKCVRALQDRFPEDFVGGLLPSECAYAHSADLVLDHSATKMGPYLKTMHDCDIGISTRGLHLSNPWKFGEYLAASKAVVSEPLAFDVPSLVAGEHYMTFDTAEECVARVEHLLADSRLLHEMQANNRRFYREHLRPDRLVARTLSQARSFDAAR